MDAGLDSLELWHGGLCTRFASMAEELAEIKKNRAQEEIIIKQKLINEEGKYTEKEIERQYFATTEGQTYVYNTEMLKALSKLISAVRFKMEALKGKI
jgi:hypothetical protein